MKETLISKQLKDASKKSTRPLSARLFDVLDDVESAILSGVSHEDIVVILNGNDFNFTLESFRNTLKYVRKKKGKEALDKSKKQVIIPAVRQSAKPAKIITKKDTTEGAKISTNDIDFKALQKLGAQTKKDSK
tara:strand:+ start:142 stop:540 length:399 start_codon:yes stop_codon:yes gene_type:complete